MKRLFKVSTFLLLSVSLLTAGMTGCGKNDAQVLDLGVYVETYPREGCTHINFIDSDILTIKRCEGSHTGECYYVINNEENILVLFSIVTTPSVEIMKSAMYFKIVNNSKFELGNLHIAPGYGPPIIMTFEKENIQNN
jgi:hypothetical protein